MRVVLAALILCVVFAACSTGASTEPSLERRVAELEEHVTNLERRVQQMGGFDWFPAPWDNLPAPTQKPAPTSFRTVG